MGVGVKMVRRRREECRGLEISLLIAGALEL